MKAFDLCIWPVNKRGEYGGLHWKVLFESWPGGASYCFWPPFFGQNLIMWFHLTKPGKCNLALCPGREGNRVWKHTALSLPQYLNMMHWFKIFRSFSSPKKFPAWHKVSGANEKWMTKNITRRKTYQINQNIWKQLYLEK